MKDIIFMENETVIINNPKSKKWMNNTKKKYKD